VENSTRRVCSGSTGAPTEIEMNYTDGFKARMVQRMAGPECISATALGHEVGVSQATLSRWLRAAPRVGWMASNKSKRGSDDKSKTWTIGEKLRILGAASQLSDDELGTLLRSEGVHEATLRQWQEAAAIALAAPRKARGNKKSPEAKKVAQLERELLRKEKALAETAALLVLQKKVQEIWGDEDDDTPTRSGT